MTPISRQRNHDRSRLRARWGDATTLCLAVAALTTLVAEYGFYLSPDWCEWVRGSGTVVLAGFALQGWVRLLLDRGKRDEVHPLAFGLVWLISLYFWVRLGVALGPGTAADLPAAGRLLRLSIVVPTFLLAFTSLPPLLRGSRFVLAEFPPALLLVGSFAALIAVGTLLLLLPRATTAGGISFLHALFTATSAVCVTGLTVVDTATAFSPLGQTILLVLIQLGGLGVMTMTAFLAFLGSGQCRLKEYTAMKDLLAEESLGHLWRTALTIAVATLILEGLGTAALYGALRGQECAGEGSLLLFSVFHAVSAFCNAGFSLSTNGLAAPGLGTNAGFLVAVMALVTLGGLGFPVLANLAAVGTGSFRAGPPRRLTLHTKVVLATSLVLTIGGAVGVFLLERHGVLNGMPLPQEIGAALFASVSARTAGFNTVPTASLSPATLVFLCLLMWIGASPGSTGGGIKTTTAALAFSNLFAVLAGKDHTVLFRRQMRAGVVERAFSTVIVSGLFVGTMFFVLLLVEPHPTHALLFEVVSAVGTVGLSTGITPHLSAAGETTLILCMFAGRIGLLALLSALVPRRRDTGFGFVEETVMIG